MKFYDAKKIKNYIKAHEKEICSVICGMRKDRNYTAVKIWENGKFIRNQLFIKWAGNTVELAGINGSTWDTPEMVVLFVDGHKEYIPCFFEA